MILTRGLRLIPSNSAEAEGFAQLLDDRMGEEKEKGVLEIASDRQRQGRSNNKVISGEGG